MRHEPGGTLSFWLRITGQGGEKPMRLGNYPTMSLAEAHEAHAAARSLQARGLDPRAERAAAARAREAQERRERSANAVTVRNVIAEWAWHYARRHRKRPREAVRLAKVYFGKPWAGRPARDLTKRDAVLLLDRLVARNSHVMARRVRSLGLQIFTFAVARDLVTVNPFVGTLPPGDDEQPRDRKLDADEVRRFWRALDRDDIEISRPVRLALRLILATAQRPGEVAGAAWTEFDLPKKVWTIPPSRAKNGRAHEVPLTGTAVELIEELQVLAKGRPHLLPSVHSKLKRDEPLSQRALSRALRNNIKGGKLFGLEPFTPHDLRRSAASMMTALGIPRLHVSKVLNHTDQDITAIYDRHDYFAEKKQALQTWSDELQAIIAGKPRKVVSIGSARRRRATTA